MLEKWDIHMPKTNNSMHSLLNVLEITERFIDLYVRPKTRKAFLCGSAGKEAIGFNVGGLDWIPGLGRFLGEGKGYPIQYSGLENSKDCIVQWGCKESDTTERLHFQSKEDSRGKTWVETLWLKTKRLLIRKYTKSDSFTGDTMLVSRPRSTQKYLQTWATLLRKYKRSLGLRKNICPSISKRTCSQNT